MRFRTRKIKKLGKGCYIASGAAFIGPECIEIGNSFNCGRFLKLQAWTNYQGKKIIPNPQIFIGNDVSMMDNVQISCASSIHIGDGTLIGDNVYISDNNHGDTRDASEMRLPPIKRKLSISGPIHIEKNVWIGRNVCILGNVTIGEGAVIGANAVVTHNIPPYSVAVGVPAVVKDNRINEVSMESN